MADRQEKEVNEGEGTDLQSYFFGFYEQQDQSQILENKRS